MEHQAVEESVLNVYRRVSPSFRNILDKDVFKKQRENRYNILSSLGLYPKDFKGLHILEIGGGTGENSLFYAIWGAKITIVEPNEISCERTKTLFSEFEQSLNIVQKSLFDLKPTDFKGYDLIICEGVLHHTYDPIEALNVICKNAENETKILISIAETHGWFKRYLQRLLIAHVAGKDEVKIEEAVKKYLRAHLNRAMKYGLRSEKTIIYDTYVNPQIKTSLLKEICDVFSKNTCNHLSSYPSLTPSFVTTPWSQVRADLFDYNSYEDYFSFLLTRQ